MLIFTPDGVTWLSSQQVILSLLRCMWMQTRGV